MTYTAILRINGPAGTAREAAREDVWGVLQSLKGRIEAVGATILVHFVEGDCEEFPFAENGVAIVSPYFELISPEEGLEQIPGQEVEDRVGRRGALLHNIAERLTFVTGLPVFMSVYRELIPYDPEQEPTELD